MRKAGDTAFVGRGSMTIDGNIYHVATLAAVSGSRMLPTDLGAETFWTRTRFRRGIRRLTIMNYKCRNYYVLG